MRVLEVLPDDEAGVLHDDVQAAEPLDRPRDEAEARLLGLEVVRERNPADLCGDGLCRPRIPTGSVGLDARIVHDDTRSTRCERTRVRRAEPTTAAGDEHNLMVETNLVHAFALSAAALPARRPNTQHSRSELPIIRFRPCVPPAISPQAYRPSSVVSPWSSITSPPFW